MAKQYQNVSYKELISYSEKNPNRTRLLDSIEIHNIKPSQGVDTIRKHKDLPKKCFLVFFNQSKKKWRIKKCLTSILN